LTPLEEEGLRAHGLAIGTPSQLSDVFRLGVAWALSPENHGLPQYPTGDADEHVSAWSQHKVAQGWWK